jgi:hypothetical protein
LFCFEDWGEVWKDRAVVDAIAAAEGVVRGSVWAATTDVRRMVDLSIFR